MRPSRRQQEASDFTTLYAEHVWGVYAFIAYRVSDRDLAEDLTQATFERALRAWGRFDPRRASARTWLLAIARNLIIDQHRRHGSYRLEPLRDDQLPTVAGPEDRLTTGPELSGALSQLSDREREILALRFGADLSGPEIAEHLGLSLANVHQIISRSLGKLRGVLAADDAEAPPTAPQRR